MKEWYYLLQQFDTLHPELQRQVYRSFYELVYKDIYFLLEDHALTEDLIQETFIKVLNALQKHDVSNIPAWIKQVSRNQTLDHLRKINKERYTEKINEVNTFDKNISPRVEASRVDDEVENKIRDELLHQSIAELKPDYKLLITLHYIEEMSYKEIAATLDMSEHAVSQKLLRARKKLLQQFQRKWVKNSE